MAPADGREGPAQAPKWARAFGHGLRVASWDTCPARRSGTRVPPAFPGFLWLKHPVVVYEIANRKTNEDFFFFFKESNCKHLMARVT